jgi:hypothetical protein
LLIPEALGFPHTANVPPLSEEKVFHATGGDSFPWALEVSSGSIELKQAAAISKKGVPGTRGKIKPTTPIIPKITPRTIRAVLRMFLVTGTPFEFQIGEDDSPLT